MSHTVPYALALVLPGILRLRNFRQGQFEQRHAAKVKLELKVACVYFRHMLSCTVGLSRAITQYGVENCRRVGARVDGGRVLEGGAIGTL